MIKIKNRAILVFFINVVLILLIGCTIKPTKHNNLNTLLISLESNADQEDYEDEYDSYEEEQVAIYDPLESLNRIMFKFNDKFYFWTLKPVAEKYKKFVPEIVRLGFHNFFNNCETPVRFVNAGLQIKPGAAGSELSRFIINTSIGFLGFIDTASKLTNLKPAHEDFGQTLGKYQVGNGLYLVLPFLGPSSLRDLAGNTLDSFLTPLSYVEPIPLNIGIKGLFVVNNTSFKIGEYEALKQAAFEPYDALKDAYVQMRTKMISK